MCSDLSPVLQEYFLEGAFRNLHSRLRSHAESIAFFGGGLREGSIVVQSFQKLLGHLGKVIDIRWSASLPCCCPTHSLRLGRPLESDMSSVRLQARKYST
jgi:hypothetical protein